MPIGLAVCAEGCAEHVEVYKHGRADFAADDVSADNFGDGMDVIAKTTEEASYTTAVVRQEYSAAGQHLHAAKSLVLTSGEHEHVHMWTDAQ